VAGWLLCAMVGWWLAGCCVLWLASNGLSVKESRGQCHSDIYCGQWQLLLH
jgi:hypothetical protein